MSKADRNRQRAREKIAQAKALEAKRTRRRLSLTVAGAVVLVAAAATGIALAVSGSRTPAGGPSSPHLKLAPLSTLGTLRPAPPSGALGPEGAPIPNGAVPLATDATKTTGQVVDGIKCQTSEQTIFHIHAHLTIFVNG